MPAPRLRGDRLRGHDELGHILGGRGVGGIWKVSSMENFSIYNLTPSLPSPLEGEGKGGSCPPFIKGRGDFKFFY